MLKTTGQQTAHQGKERSYSLSRYKVFGDGKYQLSFDGAEKAGVDY